MAFESGSVIDITFTAENDLSAKQYYIVEAGGSADQVDACDNAGDLPLGVLQNKPVAGEEARVRISGVSKISSDAALAVGNTVGTSADGQGVSKTSDADYCIGICIEASSAAAGLATIMVNFFQRAS